MSWHDRLAWRLGAACTAYFAAVAFFGGALLLAVVFTALTGFALARSRRRDDRRPPASQEVSR